MQHAADRRNDRTNRQAELRYDKVRRHLVACCNRQDPEPVRFIVGQKTYLVGTGPCIALKRIAQAMGGHLGRVTDVRERLRNRDGLDRDGVAGQLCTISKRIASETTIQLIATKLLMVAAFAIQPTADRANARYCGHREGNGATAKPRRLSRTQEATLAECGSTVKLSASHSTSLR
jgi:hypothetical protein